MIIPPSNQTFSTWNQTENSAENGTTQGANSTQINNVLSSISNQADISFQAELYKPNNTSNSTSHTATDDGIIWVPYLSLVCLIAVLLGLALSFYAHMARVKRRRKNARDYVEKEIDLNRKRLFGMMRTQVSKQNSFDDVIGAGVGGERNIWTQYNHAYSFEEDYFQDSKIVPQLKGNYCPCQGAQYSLDNSDYFHKVRQNITHNNNNYKFYPHKKPKLLEINGGGSVCRCYTRGLLDVNTFCCQQCKENLTDQPIFDPSDHFNSHHHKNLNNLGDQDLKCPPPHPHNSCCCRCSCISLSRNNSKSKSTRAAAKQNAHDLKESYSSVEDQSYINSNNNPYHHHYQKHCLSCHPHNHNLNHQLSFVDSKSQSKECHQGSPKCVFKTQNQKIECHDNAIIFSENREHFPNFTAINKYNTGVDSPIPEKRGKTLPSKKSRLHLQHPQISLPEIESPLSISPINNHQIMSSLNKTSNTTYPPSFNLIKPLVEHSEDKSHSNLSPPSPRKSDSELYSVSSCTREAFFSKEIQNESTLLYRRTKSETCLTENDKENFYKPGIANLENNFLRNQNNEKPDILNKHRRLNGEVINHYIKRDTMDSISQRENNLPSPLTTSSSNINHQRQAVIPSQHQSMTHNNKDTHFPTRQMYINNNNSPNDVSAISNVTSNSITSSDNTFPSSPITTKVNNGLSSAITSSRESLQSPNFSHKNRKLIFFHTKSHKQKFAQNQNLKGETNPNFSYEPSDPIPTVSGKMSTKDMSSLQQVSSTNKPLLVSDTSLDSKEDEEYTSLAENQQVFTHKKRTKKKLSFFKSRKRPVDKTVNKVVDQADGSIFVSSSSKDDSSFDLVLSPDPAFTAEVPLRFVKKWDTVSKNDESKTYIDHDVETDIV